MKNGIAVPLILISLAILSEKPLISQPDKNYVLDVYKTVLSVYMLPHDLDGDGTDEFISIPNEVQMDVTDFDFGEYYYSFSIPGGRYNNFQSLPGSCMDSLFILFCHNTSDSSVFEFGLVQSENRLVQIDAIRFSGKDIDGDGYYDKKLQFQGTITNGKKEQLLLFMINSGFDRSPRGLFAYYPKTKSTWQFLTGPQLFNVNITDIDHDGVSDIFCGSYAPDNHVTANGTSDTCSYIFALDGNGKLRWKRKFGKKWTAVCPFLLDLNGDGEKELVAFTSNSSKGLARDSIFIVDKYTGKVVKSYVSGERFRAIRIMERLSNSFRTFDLDRDGKDEFIAATKSGFIWMFDEQLKLVKNSDFLGDDLFIQAIADFDGDGYAEILTQANVDHFIVLSNELKKIASFSFPGGAYEFLAKRGNKTYIVLRNKIDTRKKYFFLDLHGVFLPQQALKNARRFWYWIVGLGLLLLIIFWLRSLFVGEAARKLYLSILKNAELEDEILFVSRGGRLYYIGENWRQFLRNLDLNGGIRPLKESYTGSTPEKLKEILAELVRKKYDSFSSFYSGGKKYNVTSQYISALKTHIITLADTTEQEYLKQLKHWALVAQRLAHSIKNPLTTVKLNAEQLKHHLKEKYGINTSEIDEYFDDIVSQVNRIKKMSDGFMHFVQFEKPKWETVDLNETLRENIDVIRAEIPQNIQIELELAAQLPRVSLDREQFFYALKNVIHNAVESIEGNGSIIISTSRTHLIEEKVALPSQTRYILLQIRDTGCGIPAEFLEKVTQPFFSRNKKEGTGLGLSIVKKIVEMHGGKLDIQSEVGFGTTVSIFLPIKKTDE